MYADNYNNCVESLQCADSIILPVPSFFEPDPELEKHKDKLMVVGPLLPREESGTTGEHLLITYSSGFYGLRVHFSVLESVERILDVDLDLRILLHAGGLSSKEEIRQLVKKVETLGYCGQITVLGFVDSLVDLLKASKAVVCHGGNIMFEAAMVGVPRLLVVPPLEKNTEHYKNAQHLQRIGAAELAVLGDPLEEHIISILTDERVRRYHTEVGKRMCSWNGLEKTAQVIMNTLK